MKKTFSVELVALKAGHTLLVMLGGTLVDLVERLHSPTA